jgi:hypothetical protein
MNAIAPQPSATTMPATTRHVAEFIRETRIEDLPDSAIELGKKSILDGLGLALSGSVAKSGEIHPALFQDPAYLQRPRDRLSDQHESRPALRGLC